MSGYQDCACRDCFDIAIGDGKPTLCYECDAAGCVKFNTNLPTYIFDCQRDDDQYEDADNLSRKDD